MMRKRMLVLGLILCFSGIFTGCASTKSGYSAYQETKAEKLANGTVCENETFELQWDQTNARVILYDKEKEIRWCNTPVAELDNNPIESGEKTHPQVDSPIYVTYFDNVNFAEKTAYAQTASIKKKGASVQKIENGLSVTYSFESEEFSVTVDYVLREDNLLVSVDTSKITEGADNTVTEVAIAPFFCSVANNTEDAYLFVPSGSGALIYSDVTLSGLSKTSEKVYGDDYSIDDEADFVKYESVKMPVYGAVNQNRGVCAIIEEGAEAANICTITNNEGMKHSAVYASFMTRGYDLIDTPQGFTSTALKNKLYSEPVTKQVYSVGFYPFYGEDASYVDMANIYRAYLEENYDFTKSTSLAEENAVNLNIVGGAEVTDFVFGIPYGKLYAATTLKEAQAIIEETRKLAGEVNVSLTGFTESGVNIGKPAGALQLASKLGSYKTLKGMFDSYANTGTSLFLNFDSVRFNQSGSGISSTFDSVVTTNGKQTVLTIKNLETGQVDGNQADYKLVGRASLNALNEKLLKTVTKKGVKGIGLDTLSNMSYADYSDEKYFLSLGMAEQVSSIFKNYQESEIAVMGDSANIYAAVYSDYIANVPTRSSNYDSYSVDVPFYEIVLKGYVPMSVSDVNLSANQNITVLKALESGAGLSFSVIENYNEELVNSMERGFYGMNKENALAQIEKLAENGVIDTFNQVKGATITDHEIVNEYVRKTVFSNGIVLYVNYGETEYLANDVTIAPYGYYVGK